MVCDEFTTGDSWDERLQEQSFFEHSIGELVSLYRPSSEIYVHENIFVVSFNHFSALV